LGEGRSTGEIADRMNLSVRTISPYRERIKEKLNLRTLPSWWVCLRWGGGELIRIRHRALGIGCWVLGMVKLGTGPNFHKFSFEKRKFDPSPIYNLP
jgi:hypothetical protein